MKNKVYFQKSIIFYFLIMLLLIFITSSIIAFIFVVKNLNEFYNWLELAVICFVLVFLLYTLFRFTRNRIILGTNEVFVPEHWGNKNSKIQFETYIKYEEIKNIYLISSSNNSLNKNSKFIITPMPYIIFDCRDGSQKAINVYYYSKKQVINLIDNIIERAKSLNNDLNIKSGAEILSSFLEPKSLK